MIPICLNLFLLAYTILFRSHHKGSQTDPAKTLILGTLGLFGINMILAIGLSHDLFDLMSLLSWGIFLHMPFFLLWYGAKIFVPRKRLALMAMGLALLILSIGVDAFLIEPQWLDVTRVTLPNPKLDQSIRIAVLADIQTDAPGDYEARVFARVKKEQPDLIVFLGDTIQTPEKAFGPAAKKLNTLLQEAALQPRLGMFAVQGNVDHNDWPQVFAGLKVTTLQETQTIDLGPLTLTGLSFAESRQTALTLEPQEKYHLVLGHCPDYALGHTHADLMLAGHTHGGQVRLPGIGPLLTYTEVPKAWASGLTQVTPNQTLYVSRGIGMERGHAPRLRFLCRPELLILTLTPQDQN